MQGISLPRNSNCSYALSRTNSSKFYWNFPIFVYWYSRAHFLFWFKIL